MALLSLMGEPILMPMLLLLAFVWMLPHTPLPDRVQTKISQHYPQIPKVKIDLHPQRTFQNRYASNKTALYVEPRADIKHLTPLLVHMMEVVPPEWRFVFIGTEETSKIARNSGTIRRYEEWGKLKIKNLDKWSADWGPRWDDLNIDEMNNRLLTNVTFFEEELPGVEHLFVFHSDGILCANSHSDLNDWLQYDWVGAPWNNAARFGGNGGLSLRRVSKLLEVLQFQKPYRGEFYEDQWMAARLGLLPGANMASPEIERDFAVESIWSERPMGYHLNPTGLNGEVWDDHARRKAIYEYCPEIKILIDMRLERERCPVVEPEPDLTPGEIHFYDFGKIVETAEDRDRIVEQSVDAIVADHNGQPIAGIYPGRLIPELPVDGDTSVAEVANVPLPQTNSDWLTEVAGAPAGSPQRIGVPTG